MSEAIPKQKKVYEGGPDNGLRPLEYAHDWGDVPVKAANDAQQGTWTSDGQYVQERSKLRLVPKVEESINDISVAEVSVEAYGKAVAQFDESQSNSAIPASDEYGRSVNEENQSSRSDSERKALIKKIDGIEKQFIDEDKDRYQKEIGDVEKRDQLSVRIQNDILELEKQYRNADSEERKRAIARELRIENQNLKELFEFKIRVEEKRLREINSGQRMVTPVEVMKIRARLKVYEGLVEDINHPGRREFQTAIMKLENDLAKYPDSYLASNPADPDIQIKKAQLKGQLQAYQALLAESMQEDEQKEKNETVTVSQAAPEKSIKKIDLTKQTSEERLKRRKGLFTRLASFGWERKIKKEEDPKIENSNTEKLSVETRRQKLSDRLKSSVALLKEEIEKRADVIEPVPKTLTKDNGVKTFARKAWGKVKSWFGK